MPILVTYNMIEREVSNEIGNIRGGNITATETSYAAAGTVSNRRLTDFPPSAVQDAILGAIGDLVEVIAETPLHPHRAVFSVDTAALASGGDLPVTIGGIPVIGRWGRVRDSSSNLILEPVDADVVRSFTRFAASVYLGKTAYWYAIQDNTILHTRTNVIVEGCVWNRPSWVGTSLIPASDTYEWPIVWGAVARLAAREWKDGGLAAGAAAQWEAALNQIRSFADPIALTAAASAPAVV